MQVSEEQDLIEQAVKGDPIAQQRFVLLHRVLLTRYLDRQLPATLRRHIDSQDVFQDVCFEVFCRMGSAGVTDPRSATRWILRIAHNRVVDLVRMHKSHKRGGGRTGVSGHDDEESMVNLLQELAVHYRTPSRSAISHELRHALEDCLQRLPDDYREVIRLRYLEGMDLAATAGAMNRSKGSVMMLANRALKALRMQMQSFSHYF